MNNVKQNSTIGISENILSHKKINSYLTEQYCISCAYFQQHKGNFGICKVIPNRKPFDGTIKDNACNGYRLHPELIQKKWDLEHPSKIPKVSIFKLMREGHNEVAVKRFRYKKLYVNGEYDWQSEKSEKKFGVYGLPYAQTTKQSKRIKSGYFMHQTNHQIIDYAVTLLKKGYSPNDISAKLKQMFGIVRHTSTIEKWGVRFGVLDKHPKKYTIVSRWNAFNYMIDHNVVTDIKFKKLNMVNCKSCGSPDVIKNGIRLNLICPQQKYHCKNCGKNFITRKSQFLKMRYRDDIIKRALELYHMKLSTRQISKTLENEYKMKLNSHSVYLWIKKYIPNPKFKHNGSHRPEIASMISKGVKEYWKKRNGMIISKEVENRILDLFFAELSLRQISKTIESETGTKISISKIWALLQKELKERLIERRKVNAMHNIRHFVTDIKNA